MAKSKSILEELRSEPPPRRQNWFTKIESQEIRDQLLALRESFRNGEFGDVTLVAAYAKCKERFQITIGENQFRRWMTQ